MTPTAPRSMREALAGVVLEEVDTLLSRAEALPQILDAAEQRVTTSVQALDAAGDRYRLAVTAFTEEARAELTEFLQRKAGEISASTAAELRQALEEAAQTAFRSEASDRAANLSVVLTRTLKEFRASTARRLVEHAATAVLSGAVAGGAVLFVARL